MTHHVSLSATNAFWKIALEHVAEIYDRKIREGVTRKIPQFNQMRKIMFKDICPDIKMTFAFMRKADQSIIYVKGEHAPLAQYEQDPQYQKLYEEAHIEVINQ